MEPSAAEIIQLLGLEPHPTCGFAALTYRVAGSELRGATGDGSAVASVLYFLVTPEAQLRLHRIPVPQMYHHYFGDPLEVLLLHADGTSDVAVVGPRLADGMRPQLVVPARTFHVSRLPEGASFALLGTSEWGAFEPSELELGDAEELARRYPALRDWPA